MKMIKAILILLFLSVSPLKSERSEEVSHPLKITEQIQSTLGIYVTDINNIDYIKGKYDIVFWAWWNFPTKKFMPQSTVGITNATEEKVEYKFEEMVGNTYHAKNKITATVSNKFDTLNFPFDKQTLVLHLEDANIPLSQLKLIPDTNDSGTNVTHIEGWNVTGFRIESNIDTIPSNLGYPVKSHMTQYSDIIAYIDIERSGFSLLITFFIGFFIAIILCIITFFDLVNRVDFILGAIFSSIGNKLILDTTLPMEIKISFSDKIQILTFSIIVVTVIFATYAGQLLETGSLGQSKRIRNISVAWISLASLILIPLFVLQAMEIL